ncbi:MAG: hypothetical protein ABWU84_11530 [Pyrobaculum sp.]|uniref:hypothetical protein n=1 Tax=Pyrobaculum sp. TaxID=2004705 RepID=UPI003EEB52E6
MEPPYGLPQSCVEKFRELYQRLPSGYVRYRDREAVASALVYIACRLAGFWVRIGALSGRRRRRYVLELLSVLGVRLPPESPEALVAKAAEELKLPEEAKALALKIVERARRSGYGTRLLAAAAVYLACKYTGAPATAGAVAKALSVGEGSVRAAAAYLRRRVLETGAR